MADKKATEATTKMLQTKKSGSKKTPIVAKATAAKITKAVDKKEAAPQVKKIVTKVKLPDTKEFLKAGVQFGHETKRWNPKFKDFIYADKQGIHIIDLSKTIPLLERAGEFIAEAVQKGPVIMLGTKRQAAEIVAKKAKEIGVHYVTNRWAGGFLTNFKQISASIKRLNELEQQFAGGITGRTKYEISQMKKDWERLHRLYGGVKKLDQKPAAVIVVDPVFESGPVRECNYLDIPTVAVVDSNSDPTIIDYPIPANDDAIGSIQLIVDYIGERIKEADSIYKITHEERDFSKVDVEIKRDQVVEEEDEELLVESKTEGNIKSTPQAGKPVRKEDKKIDKSAKGSKSKSKQQEAEGGILSRYQHKKEKEVKSRK